MTLEGKKIGMSQMFNSSAKLIPYTSVKVEKLEESEVEFIKSLTENSKLKIEGLSKGRGYTGVMKRWNFHGGIGSHGQKNKHRAPGSIGTQGQGHVVKGKKMGGHYGDEKVSLISYFIGYDMDNSVINVKGGIPGARNSKVKIYFEN